MSWAERCWRPPDTRAGSRGRSSGRPSSRRPELRSVTLQQQANGIQKDLNSDLRKPQVNLVANYSLNGGLAISGAALEPVGQRMVTLTTSVQLPAHTYTLTVSNAPGADTEGSDSTECTSALSRA